MPRAVRRERRREARSEADVDEITLSDAAGRDDGYGDER